MGRFGAYKCKSCGYQYTRDTPRGCEEKTKLFVLVLYLSDLSMNMTGKIVGVTAQSVMRWIKHYGKKALSELESQRMLKRLSLMKCTISF